MRSTFLQFLQILVCRYMAPPMSVITTLCYVAKNIFYRLVWYRALLCAMRVFDVLIL